MRLFLHPGLHKTGTTSFQRMLDANRQRFPASFEAYNHLSPEFKKVSSDIIRYHKNPTPKNQSVIRDQLLMLRDECLERKVENLLISNENILGLMPRFDRQTHVYPHHEAMLQTFFDVFGAQTTTLFITTREYDSWLDSVYRHQIKARGIRVSADVFAALPKFQNMGGVETFVSKLRQQLGKSGGLVTSALEAAPDGPGPHAALLKAIDPTGQLMSGWHPVEKHNIGLSEAELAKIKSPLMMLAPKFLLRRYARYLVRKRQDWRGR